jgi:hypothetical protein
MSSCSGCYPVYQANQMAHMEVGGCMYVDENVFCQPINMEAQFDAVAKTETSSEGSGFDSVGTGTECCICYEMIGKKNNCVTECGHVFCFKCLATAMSHNNSCPCCRAPLIEQNEDDDDDDSDYEDASDVSDDESGDGNEYDELNKEYDGDIEDVVDRMQKKGISMLDVVSLLFNKFSKKDEKYTSDYVKILCNTVDQINLEVELESKEQNAMGQEDTPILARLGPMNIEEKTN